MDTIEVRSDERLDEGRLKAYLAEHLDELEVDSADFSLRQFGGGMANLTYELDFGLVKRVLRRPPLGPVAASAHDMGREYKVLSRLYKAFSAAPRAYLFCDDDSVIGAPFFVMERRNGVVVRRSLPDAFKADLDAGRKMSEALTDTLAEFHSVDYEAIGLGDLGKPDGFVQRQIEGWYRRWGKAKTSEIPLMDSLYEWMMANIPAGAGTSLVHNDYKLDNVMLAEDDPGRLIAVFDWDMCTLGDPLSDLGALLTYWTDPHDPPYMKMLATQFMPSGVEGLLTRAEIVERYAEKSGRDVSDIAFYHTLGLFRLTVIIAQIYVRFVRGQTQDKRFASLGEMLPLLAQAADDVKKSG